MSLKNRVKKLERTDHDRTDEMIVVYADADGGFARYNGEDVPLYYDEGLSQPFDPATFKGRDIWCICRDIV